jgi:hypothetical protein
MDRSSSIVPFCNKSLVGSSFSIGTSSKGKVASSSLSNNGSQALLDQEGGWLTELRAPNDESESVYSMQGRVFQGISQSDDIIEDGSSKNNEKVERKGACWSTQLKGQRWLWLFFSHEVLQCQNCASM